MEIRIIKKNQLDDMIRITQMAYAGGFTGSKEEAESFKGILEEMLEEDQVVALGAYDGDVLLGSLLYYRFTTNFHGQWITSAGIGMLAVDLLYKKQGVAKALIMNSFDRARQDDIEIYYLYPFNTEFYRNFGFGYGPPVYTYCVAPRDFGRGDKSMLKYGTSDDYEDMHSLYDEKAKATHGMSLRTNSEKNRLKRLKGKKILIARKDHRMMGYMIFSQQGLNQENNQAQKLRVHEMIYRDPRALSAFSEFFHGQKDQIDFIEIPTFDPHFHQILNNTSYVPKPQTMDMISLKGADMALGMMPLALEPQKLLNRLSGKGNIGMTFEVIMPQGQVMTVIYGDGTLRLVMSINSFSSWITGVIDLKDLYWTGQIETKQEELLKQADHEFNFDRPQSYTRY